MFYTVKHNQPGMLLLLDFATAFNSLAWSFMYKVLHFFNFGENLIKWIRLFYSNIVSCVTVNGHLSDWFIVRRGVRHGENISGIMINNIEYLVSQYADDTTVLLDGTERNTLTVLNFYASISGLNNKSSLDWFTYKQSA